MLQQNSYFAVRYWRWYKGSFKAGRLIYIILSLLFAAGVFIAPSIDLVGKIIVYAVTLLFLFIVAKHFNAQNKKSIKKLVFTARVKRMWTAAAVVIVAVAVLGGLIGGSASRILSAVAVILAVLPEILTIISLFIMKPIEKCISNYYVNDAKKILRSMKNMKVIGVTGSYGKTSTKFILGRILSEKYNTLVTPENYNTPMGIVITVRRDLKPQTEIFVCEMGAKRKGDILEDCGIADPDLGVITSIGPQHLDTFGNI